MNHSTVRPSQGSWMSWLTKAIQNRQRVKIHDFTRSVHGEQYAFDRVKDDSRSAYMTAQRKGVRRDDHILLLREGKSEEYRVQELTYYTSPSDMWIALLVKVEK